MWCSGGKPVVLMVCVVWWLVWGRGGWGLVEAWFGDAWMHAISCNIICHLTWRWKGVCGWPVRFRSAYTPQEGKHRGKCILHISDGGDCLSCRRVVWWYWQRSCRWYVMDSVMICNRMDGNLSPKLHRLLMVWSAKYIRDARSSADAEAVPPPSSTCLQSNAGVHSPK